MAMAKKEKSVSGSLPESDHEGRDEHYMDIDRMVNEGLGGGTVSIHNGLIEESTTDTMGEEDKPKETRKEGDGH